MTCRAALHLALWFLATSVLGGCANLPFLSDTPAAEAKPAQGPAQFRLEVEAPGALRDLLLQHLDLAKLQYASEADSLSRTELDRLITAAAPQAASLLETEGYFDARVQARRVEDGASLPLVRIEVEPGPQVLVDRLTIEVQGELEHLAGGGDPEAQELVAKLRSGWSLPPGRPFQQSAWDSAKDGVLATLRSQSYLRASWAGTAAEVTPESRTVRIFVVVDSGPRFVVGPVRVTGLQRHDEGAVLPVARELGGRPASERLLREMQERILALSLFESVVIDVDGTTAEPGHAPVTVAVRELPLQLLTLGVGVSDDTGFQVTLEHTHRRVFDTRWVAVNKFQLGPKLNSWQGDLLSHPLDSGYRNLLAGQAEQLLTSDETRYSARLRAGRTRDSERIWRLIFGEYNWAQLETSAGTNSSMALSANYNWAWRDVDDLRTPTQGYVWSLQGALGLARGTSTSAASGESVDDAGPFARAYGRVTGFWRLGEKWWASARLELGEVFVQQALSVPDTLLFRAGGDDSVRGYAYRSLGPLINGATVSGSTLFTSSLQLEYPILDAYPSFLGALFIDAGNASDGWREMRPVLGYGTGVHWRSPVGPLRLDLAYGQDQHKLRLSFSVGIAF